MWNIGCYDKDARKEEKQLAGEKCAWECEVKTNLEREQKKEGKKKKKGKDLREVKSEVQKGKEMDLRFAWLLDDKSGFGKLCLNLRWETVKEGWK